MYRVNTDKVGSDILISAQFTKALLETQKSEITSQQILAIVRGAKTQGKEHYYQTLSKLTDILNNSKTEEEIIQKLNKEFPQHS